MEMIRGEKPISKVNLGLRRWLQVKMILVLLSPTIKEVDFLKLINILIQNVGRNILVDFSRN